MSQDITYLHFNVIQDFMIDVFKALGAPEEEARICSDVLIASDLRGIESHGVGRLKYYYDRIVAGVPEIRSYLESLTEDREMDTQLTLGSVGDDEEDGSVVILI